MRIIPNPLSAHYQHDCRPENQPSEVTRISISDYLTQTAEYIKMNTSSETKDDLIPDLLKEIAFIIDDNPIVEYGIRCDLLETKFADDTQAYENQD